MHILIHLQEVRVGAKNWPGCVSRYKFYRKDKILPACEFNNIVWREANFLFERRQVYSAGDENSLGKQNCHP